MQLVAVEVLMLLEEIQQAQVLLVMEELVKVIQFQAQLSGN
jgi:hypothetical protein